MEVVLSDVFKLVFNILEVSFAVSLVKLFVLQIFYLLKALTILLMIKLSGH